MSFDSEPDIPLQNRVYTVSEINCLVRDSLEASFPLVAVEGEIDRFTAPASGHWYFSVKDQREAAQLHCAMFRSDNQQVRFRPQPGQLVQLQGRLTLYVNRGNYQLIASRMEEAGAGALQRAFEKLKAKLEEEGLFDPQRKKELPRNIRNIAVISSDSGAALHDVCSVLQRRFPLLTVTLLPAPVQGEAAPAAMIAALRRANDCAAEQEPPIDVILLTRGGGSPEDLWCFNDERLVRAIAASRLPVVSAVGHEIDFSLADFAADLRAATPSAAAERLSRDQEQIAQRLHELRTGLAERAASKLRYCTVRTAAARARLRHPRERLQNMQQRSDELERRLRQAWEVRMQGLRPLPAVLQQRLLQGMEQFLLQRRQLCVGLAERLRLMSPLQVLKRGYAVLQKEAGEVLYRASQTRSGERLRARLAEGELLCRVEEPAASAASPGPDRKDNPASQDPTL